MVNCALQCRWYDLFIIGSDQETGYWPPPAFSPTSLSKGMCEVYVSRDCQVSPLEQIRGDTAEALYITLQTKDIEYDEQAEEILLQTEW